MIAPAVGCSSLRSLCTSRSQSKSAVWARAAASSRPTSAGTGCVGTSNSRSASRASPASAASTARAISHGTQRRRRRRGCLGAAPVRRAEAWPAPPRRRRDRASRARPARRSCGRCRRRTARRSAVRPGGGRESPPLDRAAPAAINEASAACSSGVEAGTGTTTAWRRGVRSGDPAGRVVGPAHPAGVVGERRDHDDRDRLRTRQRLGGADQAASELGRRRAIARVGTASLLEHGGHLAEVGRHGHQATDARRQCGHGRAFGEGDLAGDGLDEDQRQRVHVRLAVERLAERLLG